jgi:hypothetical protein
LTSNLQKPQLLRVLWEKHNISPPIADSRAESRGGKRTRLYGCKSNSNAVGQVV